MKGHLFQSKMHSFKCSQCEDSVKTVLCRVNKGEENNPKFKYYSRIIQCISLPTMSSLSTRESYEGRHFVYFEYSSVHFVLELLFLVVVHGFCE